MTRALDAILAQPWAIHPSWLETLSDIAQRDVDISAALAQRERRLELLDAMPGARLDGTARVRVRDGVAVIPAIGPIIRYGNLFSEVSGAQSLQSLAQDFRTALDAPEVKAVLLYADGPGGQAAGINEFADQVFQARTGDKPVKAYVAGMSASAHYWITSAASEIVADATAEIGSIGVVFGYTDYTEADRKAGRQTIEVVSRRAPLKRAKPSEEAGLLEIQTRANAIEEVFIQSVARNRGVPVGTVEANFGRGGILVGQEAVDAGLADRLGNFESLLAELAGSVSNTPRSYFLMSNEKGAPAADQKPVTVEGLKADHPEIAAALINEGAGAQAAEQVKAIDAVKVEAVAAERARITAILDAAPAGFAKEARAAIEAGQTPEQFALAVVKAAKERGASLSDIQSDATETGGAPVTTHGSGQKDHWANAKTRKESL